MDTVFSYFKWAAFISIIFYFIYYLISTYNKILELYYAVKALDAEVNTALGHRKDMLHHDRVIAKDYQDHEIRIRALRPDANLIIPNQSNSEKSSNSIIATSNTGTKANESQIKLQDDIVNVYTHLLDKITAQHNAVKEYNIYRQRFPNNLVAQFVKGIGEVTDFKYNEENLHKIDDPYFGDKDIHKAIIGNAVNPQSGVYLASESSIGAE
jgi:hypothetical protein